MQEQKAPSIEDDQPIETAEAAFRRIARQKLLNRDYPEEQIEAKISALLRKGVSLDFNMDEILHGP